MARRTLAWELGGRDDATCRRLLDKVGVEGNVFLTDDWEGFHRLIPEEQLFTGKDLTFPIEQDNGDVRHHLARFRRRSKVTSRARHMVDGALRLLCHLRQPENFLPLREPYARDLAVRLADLAPARLLETAAGTGVATRALARALPAGTAIVATDLNRPMLDLAAARMETAEVTWQQADALALPFGDGAFDAVACQFGAMFFPDKAAAYREARRVLRRGGRSC